MARRMKNTVDYFPHDVKHGRTMFIIESKFDNDGYAFWFKLLELLGNSENHYFDCRDKENYEYLLALTKVDEKKAEDILKTLSNLDAIHEELWDKKIIWSPNFIKGIEDVYRRRVDGECIQFNDLCKHLRVRCKHDYDIYGILVDKKAQSKVEYSKVEESKEYYRVELIASNDNPKYFLLIDFLLGKNPTGSELTPLLKFEQQISFANFKTLYEKAERKEVKLTDLLLTLYNNPKYQKGKKSLYLTINNWLNR